MKSFKDIETYLKKYESTFSSYNLENIANLISFLDDPQEKFKSVHVAGTSGKTSTSYYMAALIRATGDQVGLTISPVVDHVNERMQINLKLLEEQDYVRVFSEYINKLSIKTTPLSRFELMIGFAYWYFANYKVDYAVIEVGLGGLLDATNVIKRPDKVCLITDIGLDHIEVLGNSLVEIAWQKAGIIQPGNEVFIHKQADSILEVFKQKSNEVNANLHIIDEGYEADNRLPDYQRRNWQLAFEAYKFLQKRDSLRQLSKLELLRTQHTEIPGRMDIKHYKDKTIILDGAHNPQKMATFLSSLRALYPDQNPAFLLAVKSTKDYKSIAGLVDNEASKVVVTSFPGHGGPRSNSVSAELLASYFKVNQPEVISNAGSALQYLLDSDTGLIVITGSLYLISNLRKKFPFLK